MHTLPGLWHAVAALSGRIDLSMLKNTTAVSPATLNNSGIADKHRGTIRTTRELHSPQPFIQYNDDRFPGLLKPLPFAPGVLFYLGDPTLLHEPCVAIVGARKCT